MAKYYMVTKCWSIAAQGWEWQLYFMLLKKLKAEIIFESIYLLASRSFCNLSKTAYCTISFHILGIESQIFFFICCHYFIGFFLPEVALSSHNSHVHLNFVLRICLQLCNSILQFVVYVKPLWSLMNILLLFQILRSLIWQEIYFQNGKYVLLEITMNTTAFST